MTAHPIDIGEAVTIADAVARARKACPNQAYGSLLNLLATCAPHAADYIEQAPVLVMLASRGYNDDDIFASTVFFLRIAHRPKLRELMDAYGAPYPLRRLRSTAICPSSQHAILWLSEAGFHPSALSQAIPANPRAQSRWLKGIQTWGRQMFRHRPWTPSGDPGLHWYVLASGGTRPIRHDPADVADFYAAATAAGRFDHRWTLAQALGAAERWHDDLGKSKMLAQFGDAAADRIDYAPYPLEVQIDGYSFLACDSILALYQEGRAMRHCVLSYAPRVRARTVRIYSIRVGSQRVATLSLETDASAPPIFRLEQLKGPRNAEPDPSVRSAADRFLLSLGEQG